MNYSANAKPQAAYLEYQMFTFLAPAALLGALLLAIPIVVHLLKPRKMKQMPFSSLRWLKATHQRLSRRIQWHQWLLFLLRASLIVLLVLALAKPMLYSGGDNRPAERFIVLDVSRSMGYQPKGLPSTMDKARELAEKLLAHNRPGDRTALLTVGAQARLLSPLVADATLHLPALQAVRAGSSDTNLSSALPILRPMLRHARPGTDVEIIFITDNHQQSWQQSEIAGFIKDLPVPVKVEVVDLGPGSVQNAWIAGARLFERGGDESRVLRVEIGCVGDAKQERTVHLAGVEGLGEDSQPVTLEPGRIARVDFKIPAGVDLKGQVADLRLEPADALPSDDRYFFNLDASGALHILLVEPAAQGEEERGEGLYLRTALDALRAAGNHGLELKRRTAGNITTADLKTADVIFLAGIPELGDASLDGLENRVRAGAGLVVFLGPDLKPGFYNNKLFKPVEPARGLLPIPVKAEPDLVLKAGNPGNLSGIQWNHPLLAPLYDPVLGDLTQSRFRAYCPLANPAGKGDKVLARIDDDAPFLIEHPLGAGRVLVFNTSPTDVWSDLPRRNCFVPLVDRLLSYLTGSSRRSFMVGDPVTLPLTDWGENESVSIVTPGGEKLSPRLSALAGKRFLHLMDTAQPGVYQVQKAGGERGFSFVVNVGGADSALAPMDAADLRVLRQWWTGAGFEILQGEEAAERFAPQANSWPLWPALLLLAGLLLLVETYVVHRLCPKVNPEVVDSVVPQRGMLRPVSPT
jgi:hypothetical protein